MAPQKMWLSDLNANQERLNPLLEALCRVWGGGGGRGGGGFILIVGGELLCILFGY